VTGLTLLNILLTNEVAAKRVEILINNFDSFWRKFVLKTASFYLNNIVEYFMINELLKIILVDVLLYIIFIFFLV